MLCYAVSPNETSCNEEKQRSTVDLLILITNDGEAVACKKITFTFPVGKGSTDLVTNVSGIQPSAAAGTNWSIRRPNEQSGVFIATPRTGAQDIRARSTIGFMFGKLAVNAVPGISKIEVEADSQPSTSLTVIKNAPGLAITRFSMSPVVVKPGDAVTLNWETTQAESVTLSGYRGPLKLNGQAIVRPQATTSYTLTVTGRDGVIAQTLVVSVARPRVLHFNANSTRLKPGATLSWTTVNGISASLFPTGERLKQLQQGSLPVSPEQSTLYTLEVHGENDSTASQSVWVQIKD